jgi:hypothetical protein
MSTSISKLVAGSADGAIEILNLLTLASEQGFDKLAREEILAQLGSERDAIGFRYSDYLAGLVLGGVLNVNEFALSGDGERRLFYWLVDYEATVVGIDLQGARRPQPFSVGPRSRLSPLAETAERVCA